MASVVLDIETFREWYPQFDKLTDGQLEALFAQACLILDNADSSIVPYDPDGGCTVRETLLYLLMCHLASLASLPSGASGPLTSASQGSVSAGYGSLSWGSGNAAWYALTPCGQAFWQAMAAYRVGPLWYGGSKPHPWG